MVFLLRPPFFSLFLLMEASVKQSLGSLRTYHDVFPVIRHARDFFPAFFNFSFLPFFRK